MLSARAAALAALVSIASFPAAATLWNGAASPDPAWTTGSNWVGGVAPSGPAASAQFITSGVPLSVDLAASAILVNQLEFGIVDNWFITSTGGSLTLTGPGATIMANSIANISTSVVLASDTMITAVSPLTITTMSGPGELTIAGTSTVSVTGPMTTTGAITINGGTLSATPMGGANAVTIGASGNLMPFIGSASLGSLSGSGSFQPFGAFTIGALNTDTVFSGGILGGPAANLTKVGSGKLTIAGPLANWGSTTVMAGTLQIGDGSLGSFPMSAVTNDGELVINLPPGPGAQFNGLSGNGNLTVENGTVNGFLGVWSLHDLTINSNGNAQPSNLTASGTVTVNAPATLTLGTANVATLAGNGFINIGLGGGLGVGNGGSDSLFTGTISGNGALSKTGGGTLTLGGALPIFLQTLSPTVVSGGTLSLNQVDSVMSGIAVNASGTLTGLAIVRGFGVQVNIGGTLKPAPYIQAYGLQVNGALQIPIAGNVSTTSYSQMAVVGAVALGPTATLALSGPYVPVGGDVFTIINNDDIDPVAGTFAGLTEGAIVTFNGVPLKISYVGGDGNDVTLTVVSHTVTPSVAPGGSISPAAPVSVAEGFPTSFTITPSVGYSPVVGGTCVGSLAGNTFTTSTIFADCTVVVTFTLNSYLVTPSAGLHGTISPNSPQTVSHGSTPAFTVTPDVGYTASVGGTCPAGTLIANVYTTGAIVGPCSVVASFNPIQYPVTPSAGLHGTISPNSVQNINHGSTTTFTVTPDVGYTASVGGTCGGSFAAPTYTTNVILAACTVTATFTLKQYTVTPSAGPNGTITPNTPQTVNHGDTTSFTVTPNAGYAASVSGTCGGGLIGPIYTTGTITADCSVSATFTPLTVYNLILEGFQQVAPYVITPASGSGTATYNPVAHTLTLNLTYSGLGSAETGAHIHGAGARGENAGILHALLSGSPKTDVVPLSPTEETMLANGQLYVNIHTANNPSGEIRGQVDNVGATTLRTLTVVATGSGSGSVAGTTEAGAVIDCATPGLGPDCIEQVPDGKVVTLTATPSGGATFGGWSGGICTGTGACMVTMSGARTVLASFDPPSTPTSVDLAVTQSASPGTGSVAKDVVLTITATNNGPAASLGATVANQVPAGTTYVWASPGCVQIASLVTCNAGALASGASATFRLVVRPTAAGSFTNTATVSGPDSDPASANNTSSLVVNVNATPAGTPILRYRLYSDVTKEHHFTTDLNEYNVLGTYVGTWVQEGTVGKILNNPGPFGGVESTPYYRLYDNSTRWHHWTTDPNEYYTLGYVYAGWNLEGVDGWILPTQAPGTTELYRLNYPALGSLHHWTIDLNEYTTLISTFGWVGEPGAGFVVQ